MIVLDASALLAFLRREIGHEIVNAHLGQACISAVNYAEALARMSSVGIAPRDLRSQLDATGLQVTDFDVAQSIVVAEIREQMRGAGIGIADCCCLALGLHLALPILTADRAWTTIGLGVTVQLIR
jgi:ribonuclease VapC